MRAWATCLILLSACGSGSTTGSTQPTSRGDTHDETRVSDRGDEPTTRGDGISMSEARALAEEACTREGHVLHGEPSEHGFGWVFPCTSARYAETGDPNHAIPGLGPIAVMRTGEVEPLGGQPPQFEIERLERQWREAGH